MPSRSSRSIRSEASGLVVAIALVGTVCPPPSATAQVPAPGAWPGAVAQPAPGVQGSSATGSFANPFTNPNMNPYLNPYMTTLPMNRNDMFLYFMAAQQARGGLGSGANSGLRSATALPPALAQPPARADQQERMRQQSGRFESPRPRPNARVPARFDNNTFFNDGRGRLAARFPAYGSVAVNPETGSMISPGVTPAPNQRVPRYFNRYTRYNSNNSR
jgi:hypothetical protein